MSQYNDDGAKKVDAPLYADQERKIHWQNDVWKINKGTKTWNNSKHLLNTYFVPWTSRITKVVYPLK